ncbi:MAG: hypothetical protein NC110_08305 [Ruminococcus sp.]|nr:hypothetical protein [Ruminococcus sp.]
MTQACAIGQTWLGGTGKGKNVTPTGSQGKFKFDGEISAFISGGGVNEVVGMTVSIAPSTPVEEDTTSASSLT